MLAMTLKELGLPHELEKVVTEVNASGLEVGRIIAEHKERYKLQTTEGTFEAEITGNLRFAARSSEDYPAVGDWVAIMCYDNNFAIIHRVLPRFSVLSRQAIGRSGEQQLIATNINYAFVVQAVDRDFSLNRLERYLSICNTAGVEPIIVLSKTDLIDEATLSSLQQSIRDRINITDLLCISNSSGNGIEALEARIEAGKTYCLLGSSGVGKSTLLNRLASGELMKTGAISTSTQRGKHVTTHRELIVLPNGGLLIDNPGMREIGIADHSEGLQHTFGQIMELADNCRYADCSHTTEKGCAVREAVRNGQLDARAYENYLKMEREQSHYEASAAEKRKKEKDLSKVLKNYKKTMNKNSSWEKE